MLPTRLENHVRTARTRRKTGDSDEILDEISPQKVKTAKNSKGELERKSGEVARTASGTREVGSKDRQR